MTTAFYQFPKAVMKMNLTSDAKVVLMELIDKHKLSSLLENKKNFTDENGVPFIRVARCTIATWINRSLVTVRKAINELIKAGLITQKRLGLTKCNIYYLSSALQEWLKKLVFPTERKHSSHADTNEVAPNKNDSNEINSKGYVRTKNSKKREDNAHNGKAYKDSAGQMYHIDPLTGEKYTYGGSTATSKYRQRYYEPGELNSLVREI